jgi:uncharacterized protein YnzC (UPF0291/DUF896 family)
MASFSVTRDQKIFDLINAKYDVCDRLAVDLILKEEGGNSKKITQAYRKYHQAHVDLKFCLRLCEGESGDKKKMREKIAYLKVFHAQFKQSCGFLQTIDFNGLTEDYIQNLRARHDTYKKRLVTLNETATEKNLTRYVRAYAALKMDFQPLLLSLEPSSEQYAKIEQIKANIQELHADMLTGMRPHSGTLIDTLSVPLGSSPGSSQARPPMESLPLQPPMLSQVIPLEDLRPPVGLRNPSDHCWVISALQVLIHSSPRLLEKASEKVPRLLKILKAYRTAQECGDSRVQEKVTKKLRKDLKKLSNGDVRTSGQDDAANFFHGCFEVGNALYRLNREVIVSGGRHGVEHAYISSSKHADAKAMIDLELTVKEGKKKKVRVLSVEESLSRFFMRAASDYRNERTGKKTGATIRLTFPEAPDDLLFQVKRFAHHIKYGICVSQVDHAEFAMPREMTLPSETVEAASSSPLVYECKGFSVQQGSLGGGHYIAYVKKGKQWYCCDDQWVYPVHTKNALKAMRSGYIYSYARKA